MCDEVQARLDDSWYPTVDSLRQERDPDDESGFGHVIKLANGAVYSQHLKCRRYVQYNYECSWCHDWERFPLINMVQTLQHYTQYPPSWKMKPTDAMVRYVEDKFTSFLGKPWKVDA